MLRFYSIEQEVALAKALGGDVHLSQEATGTDTKPIKMSSVTSFLYGLVSQQAMKTTVV